jgi:hypothetical protein
MKLTEENARACGVLHLYIYVCTLIPIQMFQTSPSLSLSLSMSMQSFSFAWEGWVYIPSSVLVSSAPCQVSYTSHRHVHDLIDFRLVLHPFTPKGVCMRTPLHKRRPNEPRRLILTNIIMQRDPPPQRCAALYVCMYVCTYIHMWLLGTRNYSMQLISVCFDLRQLTACHRVRT